MKIARVLDAEGGGFGLNYDSAMGEKNLVRPDAVSCEKAIREAEFYLNIITDHFEADGKP